MAVGLQQLGIRKFSAEPRVRKILPFSFRMYSIAWSLSLLLHLTFLVLLGLWIWSERDVLPPRHPVGKRTIFPENFDASDHPYLHPPPARLRGDSPGHRAPTWP
jgi:hypothetical protein